jgi:hypothetical protein
LRIIGSIVLLVACLGVTFGTTSSSKTPVYKIDENLQKASQNNVIESMYSRLTKVFVENRKSGVKQNVKTNAKLGKVYEASLLEEHNDQTSLKGVGQQTSKRFPSAANVLALFRSRTFAEADESPKPRLKGKTHEMVRCSSVFSKTF